MWVFPKGWPQQRKTLIIKGYDDPFCGYHSSSFLAAPVLTQCAHKQSDWVAMGVVMCGLTKVGLAIPNAECPGCHLQRPVLSYSTGRSHPDGRLVPLDRFHCGRSSILFLLELTFTLEMALPSLRGVLLPEYNLWMLYPPSWYSDRIASAVEWLAPQLKKWDEWPQAWSSPAAVLPAIPRLPAR